jgi:pilus assembly protein CpaB
MAKSQEKSTVPLIAGAIGFGVVAALLAMLYLNAKEAQLKAKYEQDQARMVRVVVANRDLRKGQEITRNLFSARKVPNDFVHDDAIFPDEFDRYIGRALVANLGQGKTLLKSFMNDDFPRDFSDVVGEGKRAMTITVDDINSIGGFLRPGNRIDIFVNIPFSASGFSEELIKAAQEAGFNPKLPTDILTSIPDELVGLTNGGASSDLIGMLVPDDVIIPVLQNVTVLAAGRDPYRETLDELRQPQRRTETTFSHITLEVTPQQAAMITLAEDKGEIVTLLRNRHDESASEFTTVASSDLFNNARKMADAESDRASRATVAAGVNINGDLVDAEGNKLVSAEQLAAAGYSVNENGQIVDKDGNVIDPNDIVIAADGTVMTKQQLAAAGLSVNASGQIIDKDGNIVDVNDVVVAADGTVMTKEQLAASGLSVNENGEIVDAKGKVISAGEMVVAADGTVLTKEQLAAAGYSINENGEIVDKDGNVVKAEDLMIAADGSVLSKEQLAAAGLSINELGQIVDKDGNIVDPNSIVVASDGSVMTKEQLAAAGLSINEDGEIVDENGNIVDKDDLITSANGEILSKEQLAASGIKVAAGVDEKGNLVDANGKAIASREQLEAAGYSINEKGEIVDKDGNVVDPSNIMIGANGKVLSDKEIAQIADNQTITGGDKLTGNYDFVIGGASEDGVAKSILMSFPKEDEEEEVEKEE